MPAALTSIKPRIATVNYDSKNKKVKNSWVATCLYLELTVMEYQQLSRHLL
jgi:hypothetical protein